MTAEPRPSRAGLVAAASAAALLAGGAALAQRSEPQGADGPLVGTSERVPALTRRLREAEARSVWPVGANGVRLAVAFEGRVAAELVPRTRRGTGAWRRELAAHRLARALSLPQVPPAAARRIERDALERALEESFRDAWPALARRLRWESDDTVRGAMVWRPRSMRAVKPAAVRERRTWRRWLSQRGEGPGDDHPLAADLSTMVAFDYLTGRPGRMRGGHLRGMPSGERLFIDRNARAFEAPLPDDVRTRLRERLLRVERFPRALVLALLELGEQGMRRALRHEPGLPEPAVEQAVDRRATLLSHVGALVDEHGEAAVLF